MNYQIKVVGDAELPSGREWVAARRGDTVFLWLAASAAVAGVDIPAAVAQAFRRIESALSAVA